MPKRTDVQLLKKLKDYVSDGWRVRIKRIKGRLYVYVRKYDRALKKKIERYVGSITEGQLELLKHELHPNSCYPPVTPQKLPPKNSTSTGESQSTKHTRSTSEKARREEISSGHDKCKVPVESEVGQEGVGGSCFLLDSLFGGFVDELRVHGLVLDCGVVEGAFGRCGGFGYVFRFRGNLSHFERVFRFGDGRYFRVRVYRNDRVRVEVNCSGNPLDDDGLILLYSCICGELYRLNDFRFVDPDQIRVLYLEFNHDNGLVSYNFDKSCINTVTFKSLTGAFLRYYKSKRRLEIGGPASEAIKLKETLAIMSGGMSFYIFQQILSQFMQNMKLIEELRREIEVLRTQYDDLVGRLKKEDFKVIFPKPVKSDGVLLKLNVDSPGPGSSRSNHEFGPAIVDQSKVCPYYRNNGCCANVSGYASYVSSHIREKYCLGNYAECWVYKFHVEREKQ